jgi:hypothetical protein
VRGARDDAAPAKASASFSSENQGNSFLQPKIVAPPLPDDLSSHDLPPFSDALAFSINVSRCRQPNPLQLTGACRFHKRCIRTVWVRAI